MAFGIRVLGFVFKIYTVYGLGLVVQVLVEVIRVQGAVSWAQASGRSQSCQMHEVRGRFCRF